LVNSNVYRAEAPVDYLGFQGPSAECSVLGVSHHHTVNRYNETLTNTSRSPKQYIWGSELHTKLCRDMCCRSNVDDVYYGLETDRLCSRSTSHL
jgi:hypothetical protein